MLQLKDEPITSTSNPAVRLARSLLQAAGRKRHGAFLVEGLRLIEAAGAAGSAPRLVLHLPTFGREDAREGVLLRDLRRRGAEVRVASERVLTHITDTVTPQGIVAVLGLPHDEHRSPAASATLALVLDAVSDPGNAGTLLRSAAGAGVDDVLAMRGTVDLFSPKVVRAGGGGHFHCRLATNQGWEDAQRWLSGWQVWLADPHAGRPYWEVDWTRRSALIVSNEAHGASTEAAALADGRVSIPVQNVESLNVGVAGSVILFEARRQRRHRQASSRGQRENQIDGRSRR